MIFHHNKVETECATEDEYSSMITFEVIAEKLFLILEVS